MTQAGVAEIGAPRVSVVMRCYRQAGFLPEAVASVVAQGYRDWEIVVVDDGSPDDTAEVARELARRHPGRRIRLLQQENQGPVGALNAGVAAASGELVLVLDADDGIHPVFLERAVAALDADPGADVVFTDVVLFGAEAKVWKMGPFALEALKTLNRLCCTSLYRRRLWEEAGGYATSMELGYEDWDFWVGVAERGHRAVHLRQPLFFYRMHGAAETTNTTAMRYHQELTAQVILNHPRAYGPEAVEVARRFLAARPLPTRAQLAAAARAAAAAGGGPPPAPTPPGLAEQGPAVLTGPAEARRPTDEEARAALEGPPIPIYPRPARPRVQPSAGDPAVSVVIPCWRQAEYLPMAVGSVALQSFQDWELLVVDDGSPDDTAAVATRLFANLPGRRCRLIRQANAGLSAARNAGIAAARGRYVLPLDSDDALDAAFLERTVRRLEVGDVDIVATDGVMFGARTDYMAVRLDLYWANVHNANCLNYCSLYHRDVWERVGGYNVNMTRSYEDWDFWVGCRAAGFAVGHVGEPLFFYRTKEASMATMAAQHDVQNRARIILNHPGLYPERVQAAARAVLERDPLPPYRGPAT